MAGVGGWHIEVSNLRQLYDALGEIDKAARKKLEKRITSAGKEIATNASYIAPGSYPLSNWGQWIFSRDGRNLGFEPSVVSRSFKLKKNNYRRRGVSAGIGWDVYQTNAGGAIYEVMGDSSRVTTPQGQHLVNVINQRFPRRAPRTLFAAYYSVMSPELRQEIADTIVEEARKIGLR
jgi:hypothetical protein